MNNAMEYKGYAGSVEYSAEDDLLFGRLVGIRDRILFDGQDVKTLQANFRGAVDEYLAFCESEGKTPDKPFKGSLNIRIPGDLHRSLTLQAELAHKSLNAIIAERLAASVHMAPVSSPARERTSVAAKRLYGAQTTAGRAVGKKAAKSVSRRRAS